MKKILKTRKWPKTNYVYYFLFAIITARIASAYFYYTDGTTPSAEVTNSFAANFIEWFGVLYSILLPLILVRVWEQLDDIDREFDREADVIRIFFEDLYFLREKNEIVGQRISDLLRKYVKHVVKKYSFEVKEIEKERRSGDEILINIRKQFHDLISPEMMSTKDTEFLVKEMFQRLNEIVDIRGDRIGFASQRLFQTFRLVALIASIVFIVPFYIVGFTIQTSTLDNILIVGVTLLVVFVYLIIEDFDEPFGGTWKIDDESWHLLRRDMVCEERQRRLDNHKGKEESHE